MKRYMILGISLMMAFPFCAFAQDDETDEQEQATRVLTPKKKVYATRVVKGRVVDAASKMPVAGAIVKAGGITGYSVLTEDNGTFELKVPVFATSLYVSSPDHNAVLAGLTASEEQQDIMLYGTAFKGDYAETDNLRGDKQATGFAYSNAINIKEEMQKQLGAYAYTTNRNGTPGVGSVSFIQGLNSLNVNAQPLVVIDGVPIDQQYGREMLHDGFFNDILSNINPADIEKVTVMRNGTALYGAKGANGVILVETRRNKSMATRITASASAGVTLLPKYYDMMDANQYRNYASELLRGTGTKNTEFKFLNEDPTYYYYKQYHCNTDWKDYVYRTAMTQNYGINVEGGDAVANYNLSVGYTQAESTLECNDFNRLNIRFNSDITLGSRLSIRFDASFSNITRDIRDDGAPAGYDEGTPTSPAFLAYVKSPFMSPYSYGRGEFSSSQYDVTDESYLDEALTSVKYKNYNYRLGNPAAFNEYAEGENKNRFENSMLNLSVRPKYQINSNLSLTEHFSYNLVNTNEMYYIPINGVPDYYVSSVYAYRQNEVRSLASKQNSVMSDTRLDWSNRYQAHSLHVFGGARIQWETYTYNTQLGYNTGSDKTPFMGASLLNATASGLSESWTSLSMYAQAEYNYKGRYFLQANLTADGSSRFGEEADGLKALDAVWAIFPSVQASWVLTNENWLAGNKWVNYLRLTAGYDVSGNDDIDYYAARSYFQGKVFMNSVSGLSLAGIGNTTIQWETTKRFNVGLEANLLNNRINLTANLFKSKTDNLLAMQSLGFLSGLDQNWSNGGKLENEGYDVALSGKVIATKDWSWQLGASVGHYKNKITALPEGKSYMDTDVYGATIRTQVGSAANLFYGYKTAGVFATTEDAQAAGVDPKGLYTLAENGITRNYFQAGDVHFVDTDNNGEINDKDCVVIGDPNPDFYGNIFTTVAYKNFKLDVRFNYSVGNDIYNYMRSQLEGGNRFMNQTTAMLGRWQVEGQKTEMPRATFQDPMGNARFSDRWIEDGSYLKLKTITLSYDLPITSQFLQGLQFWIQANNVFTLTKYLGTDPESAMTSAVIGQGIDLGRLPQSTSLVAGVKINL
ncbi:MAG: SusC/RagA family TonB-linked outer membrane protein [Prevotella sp.]|nr:SusC/RagA family TonB-linked outer membrane protein [Prevotella sp.]